MIHHCPPLAQLTILASVAPVKTTFVNNGDGDLVRAVEELPVVVPVTVLLVHFAFFNVKALPQGLVLDAFNLEGLITNAVPILGSFPRQKMTEKTESTFVMVFLHVFSNSVWTLRYSEVPGLSWMQAQVESTGMGSQ